MEGRLMVLGIMRGIFIMIDERDDGRSSGSSIAVTDCLAVDVPSSNFNCLARIE